MSLPITLNTPTYEVELPLSKKSVKYRPYLVKEEKLLMMAMEGGDQKAILRTIQDIIDACTFGEVKSKNLPTAELELLFLKLRSKSVGESAKVSFKCSSCETGNDVEVDLDSIEVDVSTLAANKIMLTDKVGVILKYPTTDDVLKVLKTGESEVKNTFAVITACIEAIYDEQSVYEAKNLEKKDIDDFVDSLNTQQFEKIKEFFEGIPKLKKEISFTCSKCGTNNTKVLEGIQSFFA